MYEKQASLSYRNSLWNLSFNKTGEGLRLCIRTQYQKSYESQFAFSKLLKIPPKSEVPLTYLKKKVKLLSTKTYHERKIIPSYFKSRSPLNSARKLPRCTYIELFNTIRSPHKMQIKTNSTEEQHSDKAMMDRVK